MRSVTVLARARSLVVLVASIGCAATTTTLPGPVAPGPREAAPVPVAAAAIDAATLALGDQWVLEGCYDCLLEARDIFQRARLSTTSATVEINARVFEVDLLLALREKELALPWQETLRLAALDAASLPAALGAQTLLAAATAVVPEPHGTVPRVLAETRLALGEFLAREPLAVRPIGLLGANAILAPTTTTQWHATTPAAAAVLRYVVLAVDCERREQTARNAARQPLPAPQPLDTTPLIRYRVGLCADRPAPLIAMRASAPRFVEADYYVAAFGMDSVSETGGDDVRALLETVYRRFPQSPSVTDLLGELAQQTGDFPTALRYYAETLALEPTHAEVLLRRVECLTSLKQREDAHAAATQLIRLNSAYAAVGYYFRAANWHASNQLDSARVYANLAKALRGQVMDVGPTILTLAGVVEYEQNDMSAAETDLRGALVNPDARTQMCTAEWYLALVLGKRSDWQQSAEEFEAAMACYELKATWLRTRIEATRARANINPAYRVRHLKELQETLDETERTYHAAAFNAANNHMRIGDVTRARLTIEIAAQDTSLTDPVQKLRAAIAATP